MNTFVGVLKMGNIGPRAGIANTAHVFLASVLAITPPRLPDPDPSTLSALTSVCSSLPERGQWRQLHMSPLNCKSFNTYNYIHTGSDRTNTYTG